MAEPGEEIGARISVAPNYHQVPQYASGHAIGLLQDLATAIDSALDAGPVTVSLTLPQVIVSADDAAAIRWALSRLGG